MMRTLRPTEIHISVASISVTHRAIESLNWANYNDVSRGHVEKWWFNKGTSPKSPKHSGLGIILSFAQIELTL